MKRALILAAAALGISACSSTYPSATIPSLSRASTTDMHGGYSTTRVSQLHAAAQFIRSHGVPTYQDPRRSGRGSLAMTAVLELRSAGKTYPPPTAVTALANIDLTVDLGETVSITGPSGSGKSTLIAGVADRVRVPGVPPGRAPHGPRQRRHRPDLSRTVRAMSTRRGRIGAATGGARIAHDAPSYPVVWWRAAAGGDRAGDRG